MANEATDTLVSHETLSIPTRDYMREFVGTQMSIVDAKIDALQKLNEANASTTQRAVNKAEEQMNTRLESMNEFRGQLKDQAATFVKIEQHNELKEQITARISSNENVMQHFVRKEDVDNTRAALASRTDEIRATLQSRLETTEKILANWQGRMVVFGAIWSVVIVMIGAVINYAVKAATVSNAPVVTTTGPSALKALEDIQRQLEELQRDRAQTPPRR